MQAEAKAIVTSKLNCVKFTAQQIKNFWEKVIKNNPNGCWEWTGAKNRLGYGKVNIRWGACRNHFSAHRMSFRMHKGIIPDGMCVCHTCDNPSCVNPSHLWAGSHLENTLDKENKGRGVRLIGEKSPASKLNEKEALEIRRSYREDGVTTKYLSIRFKVTRSNVQAILKRRSWTHI